MPRGSHSTGAPIAQLDNDPPSENGGRCYMHVDRGGYELSSCDCCQPPNSDPVSGNRPGLPAIAYRVAMQPTSLARMLELLGGSPGAGLAGLTTRRLDDPAIAIGHAFAVLADVLSFYSERAANEGYLRTATERFSLLELAREIGYELPPWRGPVPPGRSCRCGRPTRGRHAPPRRRAGRRRDQCRRAA